MNGRSHFEAARDAAGSRALAVVLAVAPALVAVAAAVAPVAPVAAQEAPSEEERARLAAAVMAAMEPGSAHERLARLAGRWSVETRFWSSPGAEPTVLRGTAESRIVLGGRFLVTESAAGEGEAALRAFSVMGFDRRWREYTIHLCDTWGTYCVDARGPGGRDEVAIVMSGTERDPLLRHTQVYDVVLQIVDADTWTTAILFHDPVHARGGAAPFKAMETTYTRSP